MNTKRKQICSFFLLVIMMVTFIACAPNEKIRDSISADQLNEEVIQDTMNHYETIIAESEKVTAPYLDENGFVSPENLENTLQELCDYAQDLYDKGSITDYAYQEGDTCVYMEIDGWLSVLCSPPTAEFASNGTGELEVITIEPNATEFFINYVTSGSNGPYEAATLIASTTDCFAFTENLENKEVTIETFKNLPQRSIIIYNGHGGYNSEVGPVLFTGIDAWDQATILLYTLEFGDKAIGVNDDGEFYLTSIFFDKYVEENAYAGSLFYLGACNSCTDARLAQSIWDKGARGILCNTQSVWINYNFKMTHSFFEGMTTKDTEGNYLTISQALNYAKAKNGEKDPYIGGCGSEVIAFYRDDFTLQDLAVPTEYEASHADYNLAEDCTLTVYDQNNEPYSGYTLRISGTIDMKEIASNMTPDIGWVVNRTVTVEEAGPYALDLPQGFYTLTITDPNYDESYTIRVEISDQNTETNIDLITAYEEPVVVVIPTQTVLEMTVSYSEDSLPQITTYDYNAQGLLQSETIWRGTRYGADYYEYTGQTVTYQYDENKHMIRQIDAGINQIIHEYGYQDDGRLSYEHNLYSDLYVKYEYDSDGNCIGVHILDADGNPTSSEEYTFDSAGNRLSFTNSWYSDDEIVDSYTEYYEYDSDGHLLSSHSDYSRTDYTYDSHWNLIQKEVTGMEESLVETYAYDENHNMIQKTIVEPWLTSTFYYTYDSNGNMLTSSGEYENIHYSYESIPIPGDTGSESWKEAYADFIRSDSQHSSDTKYYLTDMTGDGIPELYIDYTIHADGQMICTYDGSSVIAESVNNLQFIPGTGLLLSTSSFQGVNSETVMQIRDGRIENIAEGCWIDEEVIAQYGGEPDYTWNGASVSRDIYLQKSHETFDTEQSIPLGYIQLLDDGSVKVGPNVMNYDQILSIIS